MLIPVYNGPQLFFRGKPTIWNWAGWVAKCDQCGARCLASVRSSQNPRDCFAGWTFREEWNSNQPAPLHTHALCPACTKKETADTKRKCKDCAFWTTQPLLNTGCCHAAPKPLVGIPGDGTGCGTWTARPVAGDANEANPEDYTHAVLEWWFESEKEEREMASVFDVTVYEKVYDEDTGEVVGYSRIGEEVDLEGGDRDAAVMRLLQKGTLSEYDLNNLVVTVVERELRPFAT